MKSFYKQDKVRINRIFMYIIVTIVAVLYIIRVCVFCILFLLSGMQIASFLHSFVICELCGSNRVFTHYFIKDTIFFGKGLLNMESVFLIFSVTVV